MMRIRFLLFLLAISFSSVFAGSGTELKEMLDCDLKIRQKPGTEKLLAQYLKRANVDADTVYAILFVPNSCTRCEAYIPAFYRLLKANDSSNRMLLMTIYNDSVAAAKYNRRNGFVADYELYDTDDAYSRIFSLNSEGVTGLYILKLCPKSGVMVTGGQCLYMDKTFIRQLRDCKERLQPHVYQAENAIDAENFRYKPHAKRVKWKYEDFVLKQSADYPVSSVYDIAKFENGNFFYNDVLANGVMLFRKKGKELDFRSWLLPDS